MLKTIVSPVLRSIILEANDLELTKEDIVLLTNVLDLYVLIYQK